MDNLKLKPFHPKDGMSEKDGVDVVPEKGGVDVVPVKGGVSAVPEKGGVGDYTIDGTMIGRDLLATSSDDSMSLVSASSRSPSMESLTSLPRGKNWRKRKTVSPSEVDSDALEKPVSTEAKRGRGRPPTTGQYVGLAKAKEDLNRAMREELEMRAEMEVAGKARETFRKRADPVLRNIRSDDAPETAAELDKRANEAAQMVLDVAAKSKNLKGTYVRALKDAADVIKKAVSGLRASSVSDETCKLQEENANLRRELDALREEVRQIKASMGGTQSKAQASLTRMESMEVVGSPVPEPTPVPNKPAQRGKARQPLNPLPTEGGRGASEMNETLAAYIMNQVGFMVNARLAGLEDRLLPPTRTRPPLAADRKNAPTNAAAAKASVAVRPAPSQTPKGPTLPRVAKGTTPAANPSGDSAPKPSKRKRGRRKKRGTANEGEAGQETRSLPHSAAGDAWTVVGRKRKGRGGAPTEQPAQRAKAPKLRPPRSAAVVIQLQPAATEKGATYADILREAKTKVDIASLGITGLRIRQAATGARVLEVSGALSAEKADTLAEKLRESINGDVAKITRPTKCADMRIVGLDETVTVQEVVDAVSRVGECPADTIKPGSIREGAGGMGSLLVSCPVAAAKKVADKGHLLVGWVSAQVRVLESRPMRCYKCLELGHVRVKCAAEVDRSEQCYRCGQTGHKAIQCSVAPHCTVCAAASKPAEHRLGSSICTAQSKRTRKARNGPRVPLRSTHPPTAGRAGEEAMTVG